MLKFKKMGTEKIPLLLVTANVGSIFESPSVMLPMWTAEFLQTLSKMEPKFIALHMQEVGGKTYEKSMQYVKDFIQRLIDSPELRLFDKIRIYLDEDYSSPERFTALGNMYFVHSSLSEVKMWDFLAGGWVAVEGRETHAGSIEKVPTKEKAKFPQHFFPECKWSRKGFMRTRWLVRGTAFELVNLHLFHDASNLCALEAGPSVYARSRRRALRHTLQHLHQDPRPPPFFIFGDFNFRLDTGGVVKKLTEDLTTNRIYNGKSVEHSKVQYRSKGDDRLILSVGKKEFSHAEHQKVFREPWVLKYDKELEALKPHLYEFPIKFPPSYPFEENVEQPTHYMKTRCPAWCDRILLSQAARLIIQQGEGSVPARQRDMTDSRRSITEAVDKSRKSIAESTDSGGGGGSPSKSSQKSSGQNSSAESSPARAASPSKANLYTNSSPAKKLNITSEFDGLTVPGIAQSRKSIADPTNIMHALNARAEGEGSPTRRRLVRNQSEGSPKLAEHADLRRPGAEIGSQMLRRRPEYGLMGESTCMGDHKPVFLRVLLQSDKGTVQCCMQDEPFQFCYSHPSNAIPDSCFRSSHSLIKCLSKDCFEPLPVTAFRNRLASHLSYDSGFRRSSSKERPTLLRLGTDPSLLNHETLKDLKLKDLKNSDYESFNSDTKDNETYGSKNINYEFKKSLSDRINCDTMSKDSLNDSDENLDLVPNVQINIIDADFMQYDDAMVNTIDRHLLYCTNAPMDPYTPESIDSHSPCPEFNDGSDSEMQSFGDLPINIINDSTLIKDSLDSSIDSRIKNNLDETSYFIRKSQSVNRTDYLTNKTKSVSPRQLKSRLENILRGSRNNSITPSDKSLDVEAFADNDIEKKNLNFNANAAKNIASDRSLKSKSKSDSRCKCFGCKVC